MQDSFPSSEEVSALIELTGMIQQLAANPRDALCASSLRVSEELRGILVSQSELRSVCMREMTDMVRAVVGEILNDFKDQILEVGIDPSNFGRAEGENFANLMDGLEEKFNEMLFSLHSHCENLCLKPDSLDNYLSMCVCSQLRTPVLAENEIVRTVAAYISHQILDVIKGGMPAMHFNRVFRALDTCHLLDSVDLLGILWQSLRVDFASVLCVKAGGEYTEHGRILFAHYTGVFNECLTMLNITPSTRHRFSVEYFSWKEKLKRDLLMHIGEAYNSILYEIIADFPDSLPAARDIGFCLNAQKDDRLLVKLISALKETLSKRLRRAGVATEDIILVIAYTIQLIHAILEGKEYAESVVTAVVSESLIHLQRSKSAAHCLVRLLTQSGRAQDLLGAVETSKDCPDKINSVLKVFLTALRSSDITRRYSEQLASTFLRMNTFQIEQHEETLERFKEFLGEDAFSTCSVMVHDVHSSRRINARIKDYFKDKKSKLYTVEKQSELLIISHCRWPLADDTLSRSINFTPHAALNSVIKEFYSVFRKEKPSQLLKTYHHLGFATFDITQNHAITGEKVKITIKLDLLNASILLTLADSSNGTMSVQELIYKLQMDEEEFIEAIRPCTPTIFVIEDSKVSLQSTYTETNLFTEPPDPLAISSWSEKKKASTGTLSRTKVTMCKHLIVSRMRSGPRGVLVTATDLMGILRESHTFDGTMQELRSILLELVKESKIIPIGKTGYTIALS